MPQESALGTSDFVRNDLSTNSAPTEIRGSSKTAETQRETEEGFEMQAVMHQQEEHQLILEVTEVNWAPQKHPWNREVEVMLCQQREALQPEQLQSTAHTSTQDWEHSVRGFTLRTAAIAPQEAAGEHLGHLAKPQVVTTPFSQNAEAEVNHWKQAAVLRQKENKGTETQMSL